MRSALWGMRSQGGHEKDVNMLVMVAAVQLHSGMCCWCIYALSEANKASRGALCGSKCCPKLSLQDKGSGSSLTASPLAFTDFCSVPSDINHRADYCFSRCSRPKKTHLWLVCVFLCLLCEMNA